METFLMLQQFISLMAGFVLHWQAVCPPGALLSTIYIIMQYI